MKSDPVAPDRREFLKRTALTAAALGSGGVLGCQSRSARGNEPFGVSPRRPNLLFVFSDQQSYDMLGCNGNEQIITPRTDAFAQESLRFTHCFSNAPVCTPYRGMLMSGKHPLHNGALENDFPLCPSAGPHFGQVLESAGYRTGYIGKWHLLGGDRKRPVPPGPMRAGFDDVFYSDNCTTEYRAGHCFYYDDAGEKIVYDQWQPYSQTDQAIEFLEQSSKGAGDSGTSGGDEPFALFVSWHPPHDHGLMKPPPPRFYDYRHHPEELSERYAGREISLRPGVDDSPMMRELTRDYYAMCTGVDVAFGRLMDALKAQGLDDNTIVVFTSDHGDMLGRYPNSPPKRPPHDTSARVPLLIRPPQNNRPAMAGRTSELLISGLDLMPTLLGMMGLKAPDDVHGKDLSQPIFRGDDDAVDSIPMLMISWPVFRGVITKEFTFGMGLEGQRNDFNSVLFDRANDPHQLTNLFDDDGSIGVRGEMERRTRQWMDRFEDPFVTIADLAKHQTLEAWRQPPGDPESWPTPIDVIHGRAQPLVPRQQEKPKPAPANGAAAAASGAVLGWRAAKQAEFDWGDEGLRVKLLGNDPILIAEQIEVRGGPLAVAMRLRSEVRGKAQWFWSSSVGGQNFAADRSAEMKLRPSPRWRDYRVNLPVKGKLNKLRFDPARSAGEMMIAWIELQDAFGRTLQRWDFLPVERKESE